MRTLTLFLVACFFGQTLCAADSHHGHHSLKAHEHGALKLEMAMEEKNLEIDLDGPAESFLGFEHAPRSAKEKKVYADAETLWKQNLLKIFVLDQGLGCKTTEATFTQEKEEGSHSDIEATAKIVCNKNLQGQKLQVLLLKHFPHIKKVSLALVGSTTKALELKKASESIDL